MDDQARKRYKEMVLSYQERDDPTGWFENIYRAAGGDHTAVFWADLEPGPGLLDWLKEHPARQDNLSAVVVGCGVGDDAEAISRHGYEVTAFDISPSAIELCRNRYRGTKVDYLTADLFDYPKQWFRSFDLVYECNTIQVLPGEYRKQARRAMISLLSPGANILVSCRSRPAGDQEDEIPLPLDRHEMDGFIRSGLTERSFYAYDDTQDPPVPHFFAWYERPEE